MTTAAPITEEDVLHFTQLQTFDSAISEEDSELLMSLLTAPYIAVPLLLSYFGGQRCSQLLNPKVSYASQLGLGFVMHRLAVRPPFLFLCCMRHFSPYSG